MLRRDLVDWLTPEQRVAATQISEYDLPAMFKKHGWAWFNRMICLYYCTTDTPVPAQWMPIVLRDLNRVATEFGADVPSADEQLQSQQGRRLAKAAKDKSNEK